MKHLERRGNGDIRLDMVVLSKDGATLGIADKIVFDPSARQPLAVVVDASRPRRRLAVMPIGHVVDTGLRAATTDLPGDALDSLPSFEEGAFRRPPVHWLPPDGWPLAQVRWPAGAAEYPVAPAAEPPVTVHSTARRRPRRRAVADRAPEAQPHSTTYDADPFDVLAGEMSADCRTAFEWGEASAVNPMLSPGDQEA